LSLKHAPKAKNYLALGCSGFQAELGVVVLEEAERSPTKQRLRRCGNG
jgi:hypothetical protein